jgi:DNA-binding response OmpR family regulator
MSKALILVADDDLDIVRSVTMRLQFAGYEVISASDGKVATRLAFDAAPDLVILDIGMPYSDGHTVARNMLASTDAKCTPIIFLTARDSEEDRAKASQAGACRFLTKPYKSEDLLETVSRSLECTRRPNRSGSNQ